MRQFVFLFLFLTIAFTSNAQVQKPNIEWKHYSTEKGDLEVPNGSEQQTATAVFDIDKDGINDFIIAERQKAPSVVWYKKNKDKWDRYILDADALKIEAGATFYDIDQDGDLDPVFGGDSRSNKVWWWENPYPNYDPETPWKRHTIKNSGLEKHHDQLIADFDGDGLGELVFWNQKSQTLFLADIPKNPRELEEWDFKLIYQYASDSEMPQYGEVPGWKKPNEHEGLAKADIDMDGVLDIIGGGRWFKHLGNHKFRENIVDASYAFSRSAAGQLIEGGRPEIVLVVGDGIAPMFLYEWQKGTWIPKTLIAEVDNGHSLDIVDFNGDGHLDIFNAEMRFSKEYNPDAKMRILLGDGKGNFTDYIINEGYSNHESKIGDLDGDGDYDIISKPYAQRAPGIDIWLQNGTGTPVSTIKGVGFNKPFGLQLYSLRHEFKNSVPDALQKISQMGIKQVEISDYYGFEPVDFKKLLKKHKMRVPSMIFSWDRFKNDIDALTEEAKLFGAKYVGTGGMPHERGNFTVEDARRNCTEMNHFAAECKKRGLTFFYHLHGFEFGDANGQPMIDFIMNNTTDNVTFEMDAMWVMYGGCDPVWLMNKYGERIKLIHLKDLRWGTGPIHTGSAPDPTSVVLGQGQVNFPAILRLANEKGTEIFIIEDEAENAIEQIPQSLEFLKRLR